MSRRRNIRTIFAGPVEAVNERDWERFESYFEKDVVVHNAPQNRQGVKGLKKFIDTLIKAFPDLQIKIEEDTELTEGDLISHHAVITGTNTGFLKDNLPTGKRASWTLVRTARIRNGKITEIWLDSDRYEMLKQIEAVREYDKKWFLNN